jgi:cell wall integrity and stress response component
LDDSPLDDSRFYGSYLAECRKVNGSIDDFHDYSRRILQVNTRPLTAYPYYFDT